MCRITNRNGGRKRVSIRKSYLKNLKPISVLGNIRIYIHQKEGNLLSDLTYPKTNYVNIAAKKCNV